MAGETEVDGPHKMLDASSTFKKLLVIFRIDIQFQAALVLEELQQTGAGIKQPSFSSNTS